MQARCIVTLSDCLVDILILHPCNFHELSEIRSQRSAHRPGMNKSVYYAADF